MQVVTNLYVNETYILYQCGTTPPTIDLVPAGSKFFEIPLTSVTVLDDTPYAYLVSFIPVFSHVVAMVFDVGLWHQISSALVFSSIMLCQKRLPEPSRCHQALTCARLRCLELAIISNNFLSSSEHGMSQDTCRSLTPSQHSQERQLTHSCLTLASRLDSITV